MHTKECNIDAQRERLQYVGKILEDRGHVTGTTTAVKHKHDWCTELRLA